MLSKDFSWSFYKKERTSSYDKSFKHQVNKRIKHRRKKEKTSLFSDKLSLELVRTMAVHQLNLE